MNRIKVRLVPEIVRSGEFCGSPFVDGIFLPHFVRFYWVVPGRENCI